MVSVKMICGCCLLIEKLDAQLEGWDLIKGKLNENLSPDLTALSGSNQLKMAIHPRKIHLVPREFLY